MTSSTDLGEPAGRPSPPAAGESRGSHRRWWWFGAGAVLLAAVLAYLLATEPGLRSALPKRPRTWLTLAAIAIGWALVCWFVIRRLIRNTAVRALLMGLPPLAFSVWALAPAFFDKTVNEDFPVVAAVAPPSTAAPAPSPTSGAAATSAPGAGSTTPTAATTTVPVPAGPVRLAAGMFSGLAGHDGTGDAALYRLPDGSNLVRLENLDLQNGPDLVVYLVPERGQTDLDGAVSLGDLKGNKGNQNYPVPADVDPTAYGGVLVWCRAFSVEFAGAPFTTA
jgi:hypothetical protein